MLALLGDASQARAAAGESGVAIANDNGPTQLVVAGPADAIEVAMSEAKARGVRAMRARRFAAPSTRRRWRPRSGPFREALEEVEIAPPAAPVFSCSTARSRSATRRG